MNKEFVPYEEALALKELGFNEPCIGRYNPTNTLLTFREETNSDLIRIAGSEEECIGYCTAPLYQQAFRWFREKCGINSTVDWAFYDGFHYFFKWTLPNGDFGSDGDFENTEEAELACLRKLIEIVNQNKDENN